VGARRCFFSFGVFEISNAWLFLGFRPVDFAFRKLDSPDPGLSIDGGARFVASELRPG
jgi:hypothetical protein